MTAGADLAGFLFRTVVADELGARDRDQLFALFDACYRQADHAYLERSLKRLRYVTLAFREGKPAGFCLAETRIMDLPGLPQQVVALGGLACVAPQFRRQGLMGEMGRRSLLASGPPPAPRWLTCGRFAHPASFRPAARNPTSVPKPGVQPTPWQQEIGRIIAEAYGVEDFDPQTFVCVGPGRPIGHPVVALEEVEPWEWEVFRHVNRQRGDSLLGIFWNPDAPPGW